MTITQTPIRTQDITVDTICRGQQRPYGPHVTETLVTVTHFDHNGNPHHSKPLAMQTARQLCCTTPAYGYMADKDSRGSSMDEHFRPYIDEVTYRGDGVVFVRVLDPYCD